MIARREANEGNKKKRASKKKDSGKKKRKKKREEDAVEATAAESADATEEEAAPVDGEAEAVTSEAAEPEAEASASEAEETEAEETESEETDAQQAEPELDLAESPAAEDAPVDGTASDGTAEESTTEEEGPAPPSVEQLQVYIEAVLFASGEAIPRKRLRRLFKESPKKDIDDAILRLEAELVSTGRAFTLCEDAQGLRLLTRPELAPYIARLRGEKRKVRLSQAAFETLAVIAYRQPIRRADLETIRGVQCGAILKNLMEWNLVRVVGRDESLGRPLLYGTAPAFLDQFGLAGLTDLPEPDRLQDLAGELGLEVFENNAKQLMFHLDEISSEMPKEAEVDLDEAALEEHQAKERAEREAAEAAAREAEGLEAELAEAGEGGLDAETAEDALEDAERAEASAAPEDSEEAAEDDSEAVHAAAETGGEPEFGEERVEDA